MRAATVVMPEVPKIVYARLRGTPEDAHPDVNLLAAFAEQALSGDERESVLQHLAQCEGCRQAIALSMPAMEVTPVNAPEMAAPAAKVSAPRGRPWFAWNRLGWAGLAAGVVIAAGILMMQSGSRKNVEQAQQKGVATFAQPASNVASDKAAAPPVSSEPTTAAESRPVPRALVAETRRDEMKKTAAFPTRERQFVPPPPVSVPTTSANLGQSEKDLQGGQAGGALMPRPGSANETVEVSAATPLVSAESAQTGDSVSAQAAPVVRAKAARAQETATASEDVKQEYANSNLQNLPLSGRNAFDLNKVAAGAAPAQWALHGDKVQRLAEPGQWTTLFHHRGLLCVSSLGTHVWAGGKNGALFHSADSGASWTQVRPSLTGQTLDDDVTRIEVKSPEQVVLFTNKNQSWNSADGGMSWSKK